MSKGACHEWKGKYFFSHPPSSLFKFKFKRDNERKEEQEGEEMKDG